jgi:hypothetical protein
MARHKARSLHHAAGVLIACVALLMSVLCSGPADAAGGKTVKPKNADVLGTCTFTVLSVNPSVGTARIRLAAAAQPNNLFGYGNNVYTQVSCAVYDVSNNLVALYAPFRNGPTVPTSNINPNVPFSSSYTVCGQAFVKKSNGSQSLTPVVCA